MSHRRIFGFLWPDPPAEPVDAMAHQTRFLRVSGRGHLRIAMLLVASVATFAVAFLGSVIVGAHRSTTDLLLLILAVLPLAAGTARGWQVGTYVNDGGIRIIRMLTTTTIPWVGIASIREDGRSLCVETGGRVIPTHVRRGGLDYVTSPESFDIARDRLTNWWERR